MHFALFNKVENLRSALATFCVKSEVKICRKQDLRHGIDNDVEFAKFNSFLCNFLRN